MTERQTVFVAGASGGINLAIAEGFARAGARVAILSRDAERIRHAHEIVAAHGGEVLSFAADVRDYAGVETALAETHEQFGPIDVVASGAAGNFLSPAAGLSSNGFRTVVEIDLVGTFNVFRAGYCFMRPGHSSMLAISAPQGTRAAAMQAHACAAKAGVNMLVKVLALEWGAQGIRVNAISPGPIANTEGVNRLWPSDNAREALRCSVPLKELGDTADIVSAAIYLSSPDARFVSGVILDVDGGYALGPISMGAAA